MELDEVLQRVVRRYGVLLVLLLVVPVLLTYLFLERQPTMYMSVARVQLTAATPQSATAADSLVSQARAIVTSQSAVTKAVAKAKVSRDIDTLIRDNVAVDGLGTSSSIDVSVTDVDPVAAQKIVSALVDQLVTSTNQLRLGNLPDIITSVDAQLAQLATKRAPLAAAAQAAPKDPVAQNRLAGVDRLITDLSATRNQLSVQSAAAGQATVLDAAQVPNQPTPSIVPQVLLLVGFGALVAGLLIVAMIETLWPHVSGIARIGRFLRSQPLGHVVVVRNGLLLRRGLGRRARLAAQRADYPVVVVVPAGRVPALDMVVARLNTELAVGRSTVDAPDEVLALPAASSERLTSLGSTIESLRRAGSRSEGSDTVSLTESLATVGASVGSNGSHPMARNGSSASDLNREIGSRSFVIPNDLAGTGNGSGWSDADDASGGAGFRPAGGRARSVPHGPATRPDS